LKAIIDAARSAEEQPGVLSVDVALGNAFSDTPNLGMSVVAVSDRAAGPGEAAARSVAARIVAARASLTAPPDTIDELIGKLGGDRDGRTLVIDLGDNIYGGASGRSAELFLALTRSELPAVAAAIFAPEEAARAADAGIGGGIAIDLPGGGSLSGNVATILRDAARGHALATVLALPGGHVLALSFDRALAGDPRPLLAGGLLPTAPHIVVAKGDHRTANALGPLFDRIAWAGTDGATTPWLRSLPYRRRPVPCWPFDPA
jgi:microcystin degradation protein MlrC